MKKALFVVSLLCLLVFIPITAPAQKELVLSITGEDVSAVVKRFNQSQSTYQVVMRHEQYRNWRYAINQFRFSQEMAAQGNSKRVVDITFVDNNWLMQMIQAHWLADVTGKVHPTGSFIKGLAEAATEGGQLFALPFSNKGQVLFYRRDLHEKYGLTPPRTLDELEKNALLLMEREGLDHGLTIHYSAIHLDVLPFLWSNGGGIIENHHVIVNHPANIETLTRLQELSRKGVLPSPKTFNALKDTYSNAKALFMEGKSAYIITWNNRITDFEHSPLAGKFDILPIPPLKANQKSYSVIGSWYFAVNAYSQHKEGAIRFLNFFYKDATQLDLALKSSAFLPAIRSVYPSLRLKSDNPYLRKLESALSNMRHRLKHPKEPEISQTFENSVREILISGKPVKTMLNIAQKRIAFLCRNSNEN